MRKNGAAKRRPGRTDFAVPAALALAQLSGTWLLTAGGDDVLDQGDWAAVIAVTGATCLALIWRRPAPAVVLVTTILIDGAGMLVLSDPDMLVGEADSIALFSLAVHRGRGQAMAGCLAALLVSSTAALFQPEGQLDRVNDEIINTLVYLTITALGQVRRQNKAEDRELADRLVEAERERAAAAEAERERLARELHDIAGHYLSAVVVHCGAAARCDRPEFTATALTVAAETGRDMLAALSRLVDIVGPEPRTGGLDTLLPPLCQGLARLGIPVSLATRGRTRKLPPEVVIAAYRIVQESLTNAMRYASGAPVTVEVGYRSGTLEAAVTNGAHPESAAMPPLGTGHGIAGMRARAAALGGLLDAGPVSSGGWSVRTVMPTSPTGRRRGWGWPEALEAVVVVICGTVPTMLAFVPPEPIAKGHSYGMVALVATVMLGRALPLGLRRRAPYTTLAALSVVDSVIAVAAGLWSPSFLALLAIGSTAEMFAAYAVGRYARRGTAAWPAAFAAPVPWCLAGGIGLGIDPNDLSTTVLLGLLTGGLFTPVALVPFWAWGRVVAGRDRRWKSRALETLAVRTGEAVLAERHRVATGLRSTVHDHTAQLVRAAEAGLSGVATEARAALDEVGAHARAALTDVRRLLDTMEARK